MSNFALRMVAACSAAMFSLLGCDQPAAEDVAAPPTAEAVREQPQAPRATVDIAPTTTSDVSSQVAPGARTPAPAADAPAAALDAGTPAARPAAPSVAILRDEELTCYPLLAHAGDNRAPYQVGLATDTYVAFTFDAPWRDTSHAITFRPVIDNPQVVHHLLLFQDDQRGTPGVVVESGIAGLHPEAQMIAAWAPGTDPLDFRKTGVDVGLELPADTTYTLEIHYNSNTPSAADRSGLEVCTHPRAPAHSAGYSWLGSQNFLLPSANWTGTCAPEVQEPIHIVAMMPHMHLKGVHMKVTLNRASGERQVIHDQPFDFAYERLYLVDLTLQQGDSITTDCTYREPSVFGTGVTEEMCYLFTVAYPRGALTTPDLIGGFIHGGKSCLGK